MNGRFLEGIAFLSSQLVSGRVVEAVVAMCIIWVAMACSALMSCGCIVGGDEGVVKQLRTTPLVKGWIEVGLCPSEGAKLVSERG